MLCKHTRTLDPKHAPARGTHARRWVRYKVEVAFDEPVILIQSVEVLQLSVKRDRAIAAILLRRLRHLLARGPGLLGVRDVPSAISAMASSLASTIGAR